MRKSNAYPPLTLVFETDLRRSTQIVAGDDGTVEIALDLGHLIAGDRYQPLCEIEFELKAGKPEAAVRAAQWWQKEYGLWLNSI